MCKVVANGKKNEMEADKNIGIKLFEYIIWEYG